MESMKAYVNEPVQQRSRDTLARIVRAVRDLLADEVFEELSVQQIAQHARCSVGTFYQRFPDKDAVLPYLLKIHYEEIEEHVNEFIAATSGLHLEQRILEVVRFLATMAVRDRGLIRTLLLRNLQRPQSIPPEIRAAAARMLETVYDHILECEEEILHRDPRRAVELALLMVSATIRERLILLGATQASTLALDADELAQELADVFLVYLLNPVDEPERRTP